MKPFWMLLIALTLPLTLLGGFSLAHADENVEPSSLVAPSAASILPEGTLGPVKLHAALNKLESLPVTLDDVLQLAEGKSIRILLERENLVQKKIDYRTRLTDLLPDFEGEYNQSRFLGTIQFFGNRTLSIFQTAYQPRLNANYTVYTGGQNFFEIRASHRRQEAQKNLLEDARQDTLKQVAQTYYDLQQAYWDRAIQIQALKESQRQSDLAKARVETGVGVKVDYLQAETDRMRREQTLLDVENTITKTSQRLNQLLNFDLGMELVPASLDAESLTLIDDQQPLTHWLPVAEANNPKLKALEKLKDAAKSDRTAALVSVFPKVNLQAYVAGTGPDFGELGLTRFVGLQATTNLLENSGFSRILQVQQARSVSRIADLTIQQAHRELEEQLTGAYSDSKTFRQKIELAKQANTYAKEAYQQALGRFESGVGDSLELETARTKLTQARSDLATSFLAFNKSQVSLLALLGVLSYDTLTKGYPANVPSKP